MARIRIMYWKQIPYGVRGQDEGGSVTRQLPEAFQEAIDAIAMAEGSTSQEDYQAGFTWGAAEERPGAAVVAADAAVAEILATWPESRLKEFVRGKEA